MRDSYGRESGVCWRLVRVSTGMSGGGAGQCRDPRLGGLVARYGFKQILLKGNARVKQNLLKVRSRYDKTCTGFAQSSLI